MKKFIGGICIFLLVLLVSGCGEEQKELTRKCTFTSNNLAQGYVLDTVYTIYYQGNVVNKVVSLETVTSSDSSILDYFETTLKNTYNQYDQAYGGYVNNISVNDGKLVSETTIDYNEMNLEKYVQDNSVMSNYVNDDNKITVDGIVAIYKATGAVCE